MKHFFLFNLKFFCTICCNFPINYHHDQTYKNGGPGMGTRSRSRQKMCPPILWETKSSPPVSSFSFFKREKLIWVVEQISNGQQKTKKFNMGLKKRVIIVNSQFFMFLNDNLCFKKFTKQSCYKLYNKKVLHKILHICKNL